MAPFARWLVLAGALAAAAAGAQNTGLDLAAARELKLVAYTSPSVPSLTMDGSAVVAFTIRADGRVEDAIALLASDRRLARAASEAVLQWRFERDPARGRGRDAKLDAVLRREVVEFVFKRDKVTAMNHRDGAKSWFPEGRVTDVRTVPSAELDVPLVRRSPTDVDSAPEPTGFYAGGRAVVSFIVDETGRVRVPMVETADAPELGAAALAVVAAWSYEPPTHAGRPVLAEERNVLTFRARAPEQ